MSIVCYCDGGASRNGAKDATCYGSFLVKYDGKQVHHEDRFPLPSLTTNHEAEFSALIYLLRYLVETKIRCNPSQLANMQKQDTVIYTDSDNMIGWMLGTKKLNAKNLKPLREEAMRLVKELSPMDIELQWAKGDDMKAVLGH